MLGKIDSRAMRGMNRTLLLEMIRRETTVSRTDLARRSALTKPTVSAIVDALLEEGLVREVGFGTAPSRKGRKSRLLELNEDSAAFLGLHFGVRHTTLAIANARGHIRAVRKTESFRGEPGRAVSALGPLVIEAFREAKLSRSCLKAAGVAVPGLIDQASGTCVLAPNLRWYDFPLGETLANALGVPVVVHNIAQAAAIAEGRLGAARAARSYVWVYVGSGVGAAIVLDGHILYGKHGYSGEIGHCAVMDGGPRCGCGRNGCLETVASGTAIETAAKKAFEHEVTKAAKGARGALDAHAVAILAREGNQIARQIFADVGEHLGVGISYLINLLNPELIVLGGRVIQAGDCLMDPIRASVAKYAIYAQGIPIVASTVGDDIMLKGAVLLAMESVYPDDPSQGESNSAPPSLERRSVVPTRDGASASANDK